MTEEITNLVEQLNSADKKAACEALFALLSVAEKPVDWFAEFEEVLNRRLVDSMFHRKSQGILLGCELAKSAGPDAIDRCLPALLGVLCGDGFIVKRQCAQNIWKVAVASPGRAGDIRAALAELYRNCRAEEHSNLLRLDVMNSLAALHVRAGDEAARLLALELIEFETNPKSRKILEQVASRLRH
ncbi:MAG: hypothetical protein A2Z96_01110 [Spirochaetes bacterium GWB1_48_6]|nr:MAG: hypothetical protein A2Z96_01110 [Spirochaetes bacterium GWB1_48_6]